MARSVKRLNSTNMNQVDTVLLCFNYVGSILMEIQMGIFRSRGRIEF